MIITDFLMNLQEELEERGLAEASYLHYIKVLINLHKKIHNHEQIKSHTWLKNINTIQDAIEEHYGQNSQKTIYNSLSSILYPMKDKRGFKKAYEFYRMKGSQLNNEITEKTETGNKTEKQEENWLEWKDVLEIRDELHKKVEDIQNKKNITNKDYDILLQNLVLSFYTYLPPRRNEYQSLLIVPSDKKLDKKKNYYVLDENKIILNKYKTAKKYGSQEIEIPNELHQALVHYLKYHTLYNNNKKKKTHYEVPLLANKNGEPLIQINSITRILNKIFKRNVGASMLRHIYLTDKYGEDLNEMKEDAELMGHSIKTQKDYIKTDTDE